MSGPRIELPRHRRRGRLPGQNQVFLKVLEIRQGQCSERFAMCERGQGLYIACIRLPRLCGPLAPEPGLDRDAIGRAGRGAFCSPGTARTRVGSSIGVTPAFASISLSAHE